MVASWTHPGKAAESSAHVVVARSAEELAEHAAAWDDLAAAAVEANVFHEPWMLLPAVRAFATRKSLRFVLVYGGADARGRRPLWGVFPLERVRFLRLPVTVLRPWRHLYGFLATPLVREGAAGPCLDAVFHWLQSDGAGSDLIDFHDITSDGGFFPSLVGWLHGAGRALQLGPGFTRALFRRRRDAEDYLRALPADHRKTLRRRERRLLELGRIDYQALEREDDLERWLDDFLRVEAAGWKGRLATSLASNPIDRRFFETVAREAHRRGRLGLFALRLDGRPIAWQCYFRAADGAFAFKTAYDETYARFSPGVLLQLELIRRLHQTRELEWMDSCADPDSYLNDLWLDRRTLQTVLVGAGGPSGDLVLAALPLARWLKRKFLSFRRTPSPLETPVP